MGHFKIGLGLREIELGLLQILYHPGLRSGDIRCIGLLQGAVAVSYSRIQIGVFERGEQLAFGDVSAALDEERLYRRGDLGHDGGLRLGSEHRFSGHGFGERLERGFLGLHGHFRCLDGIGLLAAGQKAGSGGQGANEFGQTIERRVHRGILPVRVCRLARALK